MGFWVFNVKVPAKSSLPGIGMSHNNVSAAVARIIIKNIRALTGYVVTLIAHCPLESFSKIFQKILFNDTHRSLHMMRLLLNRFVSMFGFFLISFRLATWRDRQLNVIRFINEDDSLPLDCSCLITFKLISLRANLLSNVWLFTLRGDNSLVEPPKSFPNCPRPPIVIIFSLITLNFLRNDSFCAASRNRIELWWIVVDGKSTFQL